MKTQINIQKTATYQAKNVILFGSIVIIGLVFISRNVSAQDYWKQMLPVNYSTGMGMLVVEDSPESKNVNAAISAIIDEMEAQSIHWPGKLVKEEVTESETTINTNEFFNSAELFTSQETDKQIERFATQQIQLQENIVTSEGRPDLTEFITVQQANVHVERYTEKQIKLLETK